VRLLVVIVGGGMGSAARYLVGVWAASEFGSAFPWGTLTVNFVGSFMIGLIATLADDVGAIGPQTRAFLVIGVLGGFTTFSSFSLDTFRLVEQGEPLLALANVFASLMFAAIAVTAGVLVGRTI
jgi:CrcB protein